MSGQKAPPFYAICESLGAHPLIIDLLGLFYINWLWVPGSPVRTHRLVRTYDIVYKKKLLNLN